MGDRHAAGIARGASTLPGGDQGDQGDQGVYSHRPATDSVYDADAEFSQSPDGYVEEEEEDACAAATRPTRFDDTAAAAAEEEEEDSRTGARGDTVGDAAAMRRMILARKRTRPAPHASPVRVAAAVASLAVVCGGHDETPGGGTNTVGLGCGFTGTHSYFANLFTLFPDPRLFLGGARGEPFHLLLPRSVASSPPTPMADDTSDASMEMAMEMAMESAPARHRLLEMKKAGKVRGVLRVRARCFTIFVSCLYRRLRRRNTARANSSKTGHFHLHLHLHLRRRRRVQSPPRFVRTALGPFPLRWAEW